MIGLRDYRNPRDKSDQRRKIASEVVAGAEDETSAPYLEGEQKKEVNKGG